jgi:hypothetical protein
MTLRSKDPDIKILRWSQRLFFFETGAPTKIIVLAQVVKQLTVLI